MEDEQRRIEAAKADPSRFAELCDEHFDRVYTYVLRRVGDRFGEEKSIREIALEMERSEGAIKQLQWRGLQTLRTQMING